MSISLTREEGDQKQILPLYPSLVSSTMSLREKTGYLSCNATSLVPPHFSACVDFYKYNMCLRLGHNLKKTHKAKANEANSFSSQCAGSGFLDVDTTKFKCLAQQKAKNLCHDVWKYFGYRAGKISYAKTAVELCLCCKASQLSY